MLWWLFVGFMAKVVVFVLLVIIFVAGDHFPGGVSTSE